MKQKKIILTVTNENGETIFSKDPCVPNDVIAAISLFDAIGNTVSASIAEYVVDVPNN